MGGLSRDRGEPRKNMRRFEKKTVLITGASRGIGKGLALRSTREGANVAVAANEDPVNEVAEEMNRAGGRAGSAICDVTNKAEGEKLFDRVISEFGALDVSIQNAGVITIAKIEDLTEQEWDKIMAANTKSEFLCCHAGRGVANEEKRRQSNHKGAAQHRRGVDFQPPPTPN